MIDLFFYCARYGYEIKNHYNIVNFDQDGNATLKDVRHTIVHVLFARHVQYQMIIITDLIKNP